MVESPHRADSIRWRALLSRVCARAVAELDIAAASIVVGSGRSEWLPGAATSASAARLEEYAFTVGEGPCFEAMRDHTPVVGADLNRDELRSRWPAWSAEAQAAGVRAVTAMPIEAGAITAGVLSLYAEVPWHPTASQLNIARRLVDAALLALLDMSVSLTAPEADARTGGQLGDDTLAVLLRADVHRAAGMIVVQANVSIDEALARLRAHAFAAGRPLPDVSADVLARRLRFDNDRDSAQ